MSTHDGWYIQKDSVEMGTPSAPHLANGWMSQFNQTIKGDAKFYTRYMDYIFGGIECEQSDTTLLGINELHSSLKFTWEKVHCLEVLHDDMQEDSVHCMSSSE